MAAALTGREAAEAIRLYGRLGETGARFDAGRVARAVRTVGGRARLAVAITLRTVFRHTCVTNGVPSGRPRRIGVKRATAASGAPPGRPRLADGDPGWGNA